jgi:hypothetical protein
MSPNGASSPMSCGRRHTHGWSERDRTTSQGRTGGLGAGSTRSFRYVCATHHYRGRAICANGLELRQRVADDAVLELLETDILRPSVVERAITLALDTLWSEPAMADRRSALEQRLADIEGNSAS